MIRADPQDLSFASVRRATPRTLAVARIAQYNRSDRRRCGLALRYCPPEVRITDDDCARGVEAILYRSLDQSGRWAHHAPPDNGDITRTDTPRNLGTN